MAISLSTGMVNALAGKGQDFLLLNNDFTFTEATKRIASASGAFFNTTQGDSLRVMGSMGNNGLFTVTAVEVDGSFVTVLETVTTEAAGSMIAVANFSAGNSIKEMLQNGIIAIFPATVPRPANADAAEGGSPIVLITKGAGVFVPGNPLNGLKLVDAVNGVVSKDPLDEWSGIPTGSGTASWARYYDNAMVLGASPSAKRMDMSCGFSSGEMRLSSTAIVVDKKIIVTTGQVTVPKT
jgi:hypothetical protein